MLRAISLAVLMTVITAPSFAEPSSEKTVVAQQQQQPPQTQKRDCEKKHEEGVS
ncbi:hypothetical protein [Microvirga solisilvae]|uniref:hypothetical protein n=1 Tax=Microvirga solisilvae TaxID=2919498 RepID=UPI001FAEF279|nr:hypothetical protein [Microvirga solisilvae]